MVAAFDVSLAAHRGESADPRMRERGSKKEDATRSDDLLNVHGLVLTLVVRRPVVRIPLVAMERPAMDGPVSQDTRGQRRRAAGDVVAVRRIVVLGGGVLCQGNEGQQMEEIGSPPVRWVSLHDTRMTQGARARETKGEGTLRRRYDRDIPLAGANARRGVYRSGRGLARLLRLRPGGRVRRRLMSSSRPCCLG